jgi:hypothetical protein
MQQKGHDQAREHAGPKADGGRFRRAAANHFLGVFITLPE